MRIGLDLDGVVANFNEAASHTYNEKFGYGFDPFQVPPSWNWREDQVKPEHVKWFWGLNIKEHFFYKKVEPFEGAQDFVRSLLGIGDVVVLTSRPRDAWQDTIEWWFLYGFPAVNGFNFFAKGGDKWQVPTNVIIEDNVEYALEYQDKTNAGIILYDWPYNRHIDVGRSRVHNYTEALNTVEEFYGPYSRRQRMD